MLNTKRCFLMIILLFIFCQLSIAGDNVTKEALQQYIEDHAPILYFHSDEQFHLYNVEDYLHRASLISPDGDSLGNAKDLLSNGYHTSSEYYMKLNKDTFNEVIAGDNNNSKVYVRVKRIDDYIYIQYFFFYGFNGPGTLQLHITDVNLFDKVDLHPFGEHQGDWEHITYKVPANLVNGQLLSVRQLYLDQHGDGMALTHTSSALHGFKQSYPQAKDRKLINMFDFMEELPHYSQGSLVQMDWWGLDHPRLYVSKNGHATYAIDGINLLPKPAGVVWHYQFNGTTIFTIRGGLRNDCEKNENYKENTADKIEIISVENIDGIDVDVPYWYNYEGAWGPKNERNCVDYLNNILPKIPQEKDGVAVRPKIGDFVDRILHYVPQGSHAFGEGPTGPIVKGWDTDKFDH